MLRTITVGAGSARRWGWPGTGFVATPAGMRAPSVDGAAPAVGGRFGSATRLEAGTTNLVPNPSFEVNTNGWQSPTGGANLATISRDAALGWSGSASLKCVTSGGTVGEGFGTSNTGIPVVVGQVYSTSIALRGNAGGEALALSMWFRDSGGGTLGSASMSVVLGTGWQRVTWSGTAPASAAWVSLSVTVESGVHAYTWWADGVQIEALAAASSYCDGSLGGGYAWSGTAHASSSTRAGSRFRARVPLGAPDVSIACWLRPLWASGDGREHVLLHAASPDSSVLLRHTTGGNWRLDLARGGVASSVEVAASHAADADVFVCASWTAGVLRIGRDDATWATAPNAAVPLLVAPADIDLGRRADGASGYVDAAMSGVHVSGQAMSVARQRALARASAWPA